MKVARIIGSPPTMAPRRPPTFSCASSACGTSATEPEHDHVERAFGGQALGAVGFAHFGVADAGALQVVAGHLHQRRGRFQGDHALPAAGQQGGHVARAGADFQHLFVGCTATSCSMRASTLGSSMHWPVRVGLGGPAAGSHVDEGQRPVRGGTKSSRLTWQQGQDVEVQHVPGADLLLDHVEAGAFEVDVGAVMVNSRAVVRTNRPF
jgi:hypothetical protein